MLVIEPWYCPTCTYELIYDSTLDLYHCYNCNCDLTPATVYQYPPNADIIKALFA